MPSIPPRMPSDTSPASLILMLVEATPLSPTLASTPKPDSSGLTVFGFGEKKTPKAFIAACDKFIYTEILRRTDTIDLGHPKSANELKHDKKLVALLKNAVEDCADELGWAPLARTGQNILNKSPEFDTRNYGYNKLGELIKATQLFEIQELSAPENPNIRHIYLKNKNTKKAK